MANELLQDMVRVKRARKPGPKKEITRPPNRKPPQKRRAKPPRSPKPPKEQKNGSKFRLFLLAFVAVLGLLFALSYLFSKAKITITPTTSQFMIDAEITSSKDTNNQDLPFDLVVISGEEKKNIQGGQMTEVSISAKGEVVVYNNYSSATQTLDIDTRLLGSNGKVYKTEERIVVPGKTGGTPGSVAVGVYATDPGESYNSGPLDFKIVGFQGGPKYDGFYARSSGDITGGFVGESPMVSDLDRASAENELQANLEKKLLSKIIDQIPDGFVLYESAVLLDMSSGPTLFTPLDEGFVEASVQGTLYGFIFDEEQLSEKLATLVLEGYNGEDLFVRNIKSLEFEFINPEDISFSNLQTISFKLSGEPLFIYEVEEEQLIAEVLGREKSYFNEIISTYPNVDSAEIVFRPFWKKSFPEERDAIEIVVDYP